MNINALTSAASSARCDATEKEGHVNNDVLDVPVEARAAPTTGRASEAAPCPLQPCYFDKWDLFADTWDCQYAMGFPVCIFTFQYVFSNT